MKDFVSFLTFISLFTMVSCTNQKENNQSNQSSCCINLPMDAAVVAPNDVLASVNLTVSEGKRLIAKGIANSPEVRERMEKGIIIITRGTTNTYLAEELVGIQEPHGTFLTGHFVPVGAKRVGTGVEKKLTEIIIVNGKTIEASYEEGLRMLKEGDLIFKGGNLLNYAKQQAGVCVGAPDGGTVYRLLPYVGEKKAKLIVPIGLEKDTSFDLNLIQKNLNQKNEKQCSLPKIFLYEGVTIYTEIEALQQFANVKVFPYGIGGVNGREGGISLVIAGSSEEVNKALEVVKLIQGEHSF